MPTRSAAAVDQASRPRLQFLPELLKRSVWWWVRLPGERSCAADKRQLIADIREFNTSASPRFLSQFDVAALRQYLDHLTAAHTRGVTETSRADRDEAVRASA